MKKEHREYILAHYQKKSPKAIAKTLQIKERTVLRFLNSQKQRVEEKREEVKPRKEKKRISWGLLILVGLVSFLVYANSLPGEFIWDDNILIRNNIEIKDWRNLPKVIFGNLGGENLYYKHSSYRPVQTITYMIDYHFGQMKPFGYRLTNVLCHMFVALSLYCLIFTLFNNNTFSFITSLFYCLHPIHTEAVAYISGRADPLSSIFMILSIVFYLKIQQGGDWRFYFLLLLSYLFGILSRENALMAPAFILIYHFAYRIKIAWKPFLSMIALAGIYIILRVTETIGGMGLTEPVKTSIFDRIPGFLVALTGYVKLMLWPFDLHMERGRPLFEMSHPEAIIGLLIFLALWGAAFYFWKKKPIICFGILWFFVGIFPVSNTMVVVNAYMAEHWLYFPSIGIFLILAVGVSKLYEKESLRPVAVGLVVLLAGFWAVRTVQQNTTWLNQISFYERTRKYAPKSSRLHADLGEAYYRVGRKEDSLQSTLQAIKLRPSYYAAWSNLGTIYVSLGNLDKAVEAYKQSLKIRPGYFNALFNLANIYKDQDNCKEAVELYKQAIQFKPSLANAYNNIGICYSRMGDKESAIKFYEMGLKIDPKNSRFFNNIASTYSDLGKHDKAIALYEAALKGSGLDLTNQAIVKYNLALAYSRVGQKEKALRTFEEASALPIRNSSLFKQLAAIYAKAGLTKQAQLLMQKAAVQ